MRGTIGSHTVGNALVLHARDRISSAAQSLALAIAADPDHDIVVLDLHADLPAGIWEAVAARLPRRRRGVRLITCGVGHDTAALAGQWLSDRLGRPVVVAHGQLIRGGHGGVFVHDTEGSGWVRYRPGRTPEWVGKRYPQPGWDGLAAHLIPTSAHGVIEPVPAGVWIRDTRDEAAVAAHWRWLVSNVPCRPSALTVLLGCPGTPELPLDDVARFWRGLAAEGRSRTRFVGYGPVRLPPGRELGRALADLLAEPVVLLAGIPTGRPDRPVLQTVPDDGELGWAVGVHEIEYTPDGTSRILTHEPPGVLGAPVGPLTYHYTDDAVVEIVPAGLWIRPPVAPDHAARIRSRAIDPATHVILVDDADPELLPRLRELAEDLQARLDPRTRVRSVVSEASAPAAATPRPLALAGSRPPPAPTSDLLGPIGPVESVVTAAAEMPDLVLPREVPTLPAAPDRPVAARAVARVEEPDPLRATGALRAPTARLPMPLERPRPSNALVIPTAELAVVRPHRDEREVVAERAWLLSTFADELEAAVSVVSQAFAEQPGLHADPDMVVDAIAVRLYLSSLGAGLDESVRAGSLSARAPFARGVAGGLSRLPHHRGLTVTAAHLTGDQLRGLQEQHILTEGGFTHALAEPTQLPGNTDVLIWSLTGRRTRFIEPDDDWFGQSRVVFLPGTSFEVLDVHEATLTRRGRLMLGELPAPSEPAGDPYDDAVLDAVAKGLGDWSLSAPAATARVPVSRFGAVPGSP